MHFLYSSLLINHIITFLFFILPMPFSIINTWKFGILFEFLWPTCCNLYLKRVLSINQCVLKKLNFICVCVLSIWEKIYKNAWLQSSHWFLCSPLYPWSLDKLTRMISINTQLIYQNYWHNWCNCFKKKEKEENRRDCWNISVHVVYH
jgi:hypothetical protein